MWGKNDLYLRREGGNEDEGSEKRSTWLLYTIQPRHGWRQKGREGRGSRTINSPHDSHRPPVPPFVYPLSFPDWPPHLSLFFVVSPPPHSAPAIVLEQWECRPRFSEIVDGSGRSIQCWTRITLQIEEKFDRKVVTLLEHMQQGKEAIITKSESKEKLGCTLFPYPPPPRVPPRREEEGEERIFVDGRRNARSFLPRDVAPWLFLRALPVHTSAVSWSCSAPRWSCVSNATRAANRNTRISKSLNCIPSGPSTNHPPIGSCASPYIEHALSKSQRHSRIGQVAPHPALDHPRLPLHGAHG